MPIGAALVYAPKDTAAVIPTGDGLPNRPSISTAQYLYMVTGTQPAEDDPAFDCRLHGNRICGPGNAQGVPPGQYADVAPGTTLVSLLLGGVQ